MLGLEIEKRIQARELIELASWNFDIPMALTIAKYLSDGKDVGSSRWENACGNSPFPTVPAAD